jgi:hypothetical protein
MHDRDPINLQTTMLLAAVHYAWRTGSMKGYEKAYLYYRYESIRFVNELIVADVNKISIKGLKLIAMLSLIEVSLLLTTSMVRQLTLFGVDSAALATLTLPKLTSTLFC